MHLVKLDAIDSTNDFLKMLVTKQMVKNHTVVSAETQTKGRGQMGSVWQSESGKNLTMSLLVKNSIVNTGALFQLNIAVALAVIDVLQGHAIPLLSIKWPNDIMSGNHKIGGILIENSIKSDGIIDSIIGLGLNVNQFNFENLPQASSLAVVAGKLFDKDALLVEMGEMLIKSATLLSQNVAPFYKRYNSYLFKRSVPMPFENVAGFRFMGIIQDVAEDGRLQIILEDESIKRFDIKELKMLY